MSYAVRQWLLGVVPSLEAPHLEAFFSLWKWRWLIGGVACGKHSGYVLNPCWRDEECEAMGEARPPRREGKISGLLCCCVGCVLLKLH